MPKMDVPQPVYDWLLTIKTQLRIRRGRNVAWPEVFEYIQQQHQAAQQPCSAGTAGQ